MKDNVLYNNVTPLPRIRSHFRRKRIEKLLIKAVNYPLVTITAGAGYGKTQAVSVFLDNNDMTFSWLHLSRLDNITTRFWESFTNAVAVHDQKCSSQLLITEFPHSAMLFNDLLHKFGNIYAYMDKFILVFDDYHLINESAIISFIENLLYARLKNLTIILISRTKPKLDIKGLITDDLLFQITEEDLYFTMEETCGYFRMQGIELSEERLNEIYSKTEGWIAAIYLVCLSVRKERKTKYALAQAKQSIYELISQEIFSGYTLEMQNILVRLSLLEKIPLEIFLILFNGNMNLLKEIDSNNRFIHYDPVTETVRIHNLYLDFLSERQFQLTEEDVMETHRIIADWYNSNGSKIDAIEHYQKCGCYEKIWDIISSYEIAMPTDTADMFLRLLEEFPKEFTKSHPLASVVHARLLLNNGRMEECMREFTNVINKYEALAPTAENKAIIGESCLFTGMVSLLSYDYKFVELFKKADEYLPNGSSLIDNRLGFSEGTFMLAIKEPSDGELDRFLDSVEEVFPYAARAMNGCTFGAEYATKAEAAYYRGDMNEAKINAHKAILLSEQKLQYDTMCAAYFILIRVYISSGNYSKSADCLKRLTQKIENTPSENYVYVKNCIYTRDIITGWCYSRVSDLEKIPDWILGKGEKLRKVSPNNYRDQFIYAYCLLTTEKYHQLSALADTLEIHYDANGLLPARLEVQIYKAIAAHKNKDVEQSMAALQKAYNLAHANSLILPFVELGKDMCAVIYSAKRQSDVAFPDEWLSEIYTKSSTYVKQLKNVREQYKISHGFIEDNQYRLTKREKDVLRCICKGLTRKEIAESFYISISTVKQTLSSIYNKLGVENRSEAIRIAIQKELDK